MLRLRERALGARGQDFFGALPMGVGLIEALLFANRPVIAWAVLFALAILGVLLSAGTWYFNKQDLVNRWYRAAYWTGWTVSVLFGALLIGAVVIWAITRPPTGEFPPVSEVFVVLARVGFFLDALLIAGLAAMGWFAQGTQATRALARSWRRSHGTAGARSPEENTPSE